MKALKLSICETKLSWDCKQSLWQLTERNLVIMMWLRGHKGLKGNEEVDFFATVGAIIFYPDLEPLCGLPNGHIKEELR